MKIKVREASDVVLDYLVAKAWQPVYSDEHLLKYAKYFNPSTNWKYGGSIIEREVIGIEFDDCEEVWFATITSGDGQQYITLDGPTPLIAAMRCFVSSRLGDEVDVPEELT